MFNEENTRSCTLGCLVLTEGKFEGFTSIKVPKMHCFQPSTRPLLQHVALCGLEPFDSQI